MLRKLIVISLTILAFGSSFRVREARSNELNVETLQKQIFDVVEKTAPAIVEISRRGSLFSGVIVSPQGHVFTAGHTVTPNLEYTIVLSDGRRLKGRSLGSCEQLRGERIDVGLIKIENENDLPYAKIGSSASLQMNQPCLSISFPGGQRKGREPMVRFGHINRSVRKGSMIQSSALMEPGDSGGPLFDLEGRVIGIHSRISPEIQQNFDVPVDAFKEYWDQLNFPAVFHTQDGKQLPKLGFFGEDFPEKKGIRILEVTDGGIAKELGIQPEDLLIQVQDKGVAKLQELQQTLQEIVQTKPEIVKVTVQREDKIQEFQFPSSRFVCPKAERFEGLDTPQEIGSKAFPQLAAFPRVFADKESRWDDHCCTIDCTTNGKKSTLLGTYIAGTSLVVSKNSMLGDDPSTVSGGKRISLEIVARDDANDLVLLRSSEPNLSGVTLTSTVSPERLKRGQLLLSPDPNGDGFTSVVSSSQFSSTRQVSRGYLGVVLQDHDQGGVVLVQVDEGAARRAGLQPGDVIYQVNEKTIRNRPEILKFLGSVDPQTNIKAKVRRETTEFEAQITLGAPPSDTGHAADMMEKSLRRDGFTSVVSHDSLIPTQGCGGPVYDLDGNFVGLNIARHSRVRTFFVPATLVRQLVEKQAK